MRSLSRVLAMRFTLTMFAALTAIGLGAAWGVHRALVQALDRGLAAALALEADVLANGLSVAQHAAATDRATFVGSVNRFVAVRDSNGHVVATNTPLARQLPLDPAAFAAALAGRRRSGVTSGGSFPTRSIYARAPDGAFPGYAVVQVAASTSPLATTSRQVLGLVILTIGFGTVITARGARWLSRSATAPVREITDRAAAISPSTPGRRISAHADTREFRGLVDVLNSMLGRLDGALDGQRRIIRDVAHELRTPITSIQGTMEVALRGSRTAEEYRDMMASCLEDIDHLASINEAALLLARLETGEIRPDHAPVDVHGLVHGAVERVRELDPSRTYRMDSSATALPSALADEELVQIVVTRLLENITKHTPPGTTARVSVAPRDGHVALAIEDDGPGLPEAAFDQLFERFYQADPARTRRAGAGLGLTIAAAIAVIHGGEIHAERSAMGGLKVSVRLPIAADTPVPSPSL